MKNKLYLKGKKSFRFAIPIKKSLSWTSSIWLYILERAKVHSVVLSINFKCFRPSRHFLQIYSQSGTTETSCFSHSKVPTTQFLDLITECLGVFKLTYFSLQTFLFPIILLVCSLAFFHNLCKFWYLPFPLPFLIYQFLALPHWSSSFWRWWGISSVIYAHLAWLPLQSLWSHNTAILITTTMHQHFQSNTRLFKKFLLKILMTQYFFYKMKKCVPLPGTFSYIHISLL